MLSGNKKAATNEPLFYCQLELAFSPKINFMACICTRKGRVRRIYALKRIIHTPKPECT
jgi:hypothetical protein